MSVEIIVGDSREVLSRLPDESVQCCVTSPPYWGLRDYGVDGQMGLEKTPQEYVAKMVEVFREVRRVLREDGTLWLNLGDSYSGSGKGGNPVDGKQATNHGSQSVGVLYSKIGDTAREAAVTNVTRDWAGLPPKNLIGIPWRVAFALQEDGWWLRSDNIWGKPNGMPESTLDRPTRAHEYVFQLSKSDRYFYDYESVRLPPLPSSVSRLEQHIEDQIGSVRANGGGKENGAMKAVRRTDKQRGHTRRHSGFNDRWDSMTIEEQQCNGAALRSVWWISPAQFAEAHFAVMPRNLAAVCIMAGSRAGDTIIDPFGGSGTTGLVALELGRKAVLIELNPEYAKLAEQRCNVTPGLALP